MINNTAFKFRFLTLSISLVFLFSLSSCTKEAETEDVSKLSTALFTALQHKDYQKALTFYSDEFFGIMPPKAWVDKLKDNNIKLGDLVKVKLKSETASTIFSGRRFIFIYTNQYQNGLAKETVIFFQKINTEEIKVHSHKIESSKLPGSRR